MEITGLLQQDAEFQQLASGLKKGGRHLMTGISGTARTVYLAALQQETQRPMVVVGDSQFLAGLLRYSSTAFGVFRRSKYVEGNF